MTYFTLENPVKMDPYRFDFHSHFSGILPFDDNTKYDQDCYSKTYSLTNSKRDKASYDVRIDKGDTLSIIGMLMKKSVADTVEEKKVDAHRMLFKKAMNFMASNKNPFIGNDKLHVYQRGECAAETLYFGSVIIIEKFNALKRENKLLDEVFSPVKNSVATLADSCTINNVEVYFAAKNIIDALSNAKGMDCGWLDQLIAYINRKIMSANKYTPFDDAYWARDIVRDDDDYRADFIATTLCYLLQSGIIFTQAALGIGTAKELDTIFAEFNEEFGTDYTLLGHSAEIYDDNDVKFEEKIKEIINAFNSPPIKNIVGIDLLGPENRTGHYEKLFKILNECSNIDKFNENITSGACKKINIHIHCGEGSGCSSINRSICGFYLRHDVSAERFKKFFLELNHYVFRCYTASLVHADARNRERERRSDSGREFNPVSGLFDELFCFNRFSFDGFALHRFDITSSRSQSLVAYSGKTNLMHLCSALDKQDGGKSYYQILTDHLMPYSIRIGHAYYYRNYLCSRYPNLFYDTNLGSNFITGASGLFDSAQVYRLNRGLRHLNGFIDSEILERATEAVAYMKEDRLNNPQLAYACQIAETLVKKGEVNLENTELLKSVLGSVPDYILESIKTFINNQTENYWFMIIDEKNHHQRVYQDKEIYKKIQLAAAVRICNALLAVALNWRSYLLGADGQGVEHSNVQVEALRMSILLAYGVDSRINNLSDEVINEFSRLLNSVSECYWSNVVRDTCKYAKQQRTITRTLSLKRLSGFASPRSTVLVDSDEIALSL